VVAVGNLDKVWLDLPEAGEAELRSAFAAQFGKDWEKVLINASKPFSYHAANQAYFGVREIRSLEGLFLHELVEPSGAAQPVNIIAS